MRLLMTLLGSTAALLLLLTLDMAARQWSGPTKATEVVQSTYLLGRTGADTLVGNAIEEGADVNIDLYSSGTLSIVKGGA